MPVVGFLNSASPGAARPFVDAFRLALEKAGFIEGRNLTIAYRWAEGNYSQLPALANDLVRLNVAVIAATGGLVTAKAAEAATSTIPVLFIAGFDPVREGLASSINHPGGNATGVSVYTAELGRKRLELLRALLPRLSRVAMLVNPGATSTEVEAKDLGAAAQDAKLDLIVIPASTVSDLETAFGEAARRRAGAVIVSADAFFTSRYAQIVALAARHSLPASYPWSRYASAGGLFSYGPPLTWAYEQIGVYTAEILKGASPGDLPIQLPTKFQTVINLKTAKSLGLAVPPQLLALADEVIE